MGKKGPEKQTGRIRQIFEDASSEPEFCKYVMRKRNGEKVKGESQEPFIGEASHTLYIGKTIQAPIAARVRRTLGWGKPGDPYEKAELKNLYSEEFIKSALEYLSRHLKPDEKIRIVLARSCSEIFNGPEDVERALTITEQTTLIQKVAEEIGTDPSRLEIIDLEKNRRHAALFQALRGAIDSETGKLDAKEAFTSTEHVLVGHEAISWYIARELYQAYISHPTFAALFQGTVPDELADAESETDQNNPKNFYGLAEVAIRLTDIIEGVHIHSGSSRQTRYDKIIEELLKGEKGGFKHIPELEVIFKRIEESEHPDFETLYIFADKEYHKKRRRKNRALTQLATAGAVGFSVLAGIGAHEGNKWIDERKTEEDRISRTVKEKTKDVLFRFDNKNLLKQDNPNATRSVARSMMARLGQRYQLNPTLQMELKPLLLDFLMANTELLSDAYESDAKEALVIDIFVERFALFLSSKGVNTEEGPFSHIKPHFQTIWDAAHGKDERTVRTKMVYAAPHQFEAQIEDTNLHPIVTFVEPEEFGGSRTLYSYEDEEGASVVARDRPAEWTLHSAAQDTGKKYDTSLRIFTAKEGKEAAEAFILSVRKFDLLQLYEWKDAIIYTCSGEPDTFVKDAKFKTDHGMSKWSKPYIDTWGEWEYYVTKWNYLHKDEHSQKYRDYILARLPNETHYTYERGKEAAQRFCTIWHAQ